MSNDLTIPMKIEGGEIQVKASVGQTVIKVVAPDEYTGLTEVTPSDSEQVLATKDKLVRDDITIEAIRTEPVIIMENGNYFPAPDTDGFSEVVVDVPMGEWSAPVPVYEGDFDAVTNVFAVTELPNGEPFAFDRIVIELSNALQGQNVNKRTYWRRDLPMTGNPEQVILDNGSQYWQGNTYSAVSTMTIEDDTYISVSTVKEISKESTSSFFMRKEHGGYDKITAYGWWSWACPAGSHIKITGYNRTGA